MRLWVDFRNAWELGNRAQGEDRTDWTAEAVNSWVAFWSLVGVARPPGWSSTMICFTSFSA